jgi:hypothetical protein
MWWAALLLMSGNVFADIGAVADTKGTNCQIERNKQKLPGDKGVSVESMDTYTTGGCVANITFKDDTKVKVNENSRLLIDDFVFDPKQSDAGKLALKIGMGTVRYASGQIAKNNPQQVGIQTPTATIAVRGTDFAMTVDEAGQSLIMLVPSCKDEKDVKQYELQENTCKVGKIEVSTLAGTVSLDKAFEATYVQSSTTSPTLPTAVSTIESKINNNLILVKPIEVQKAIKEAGKSPKDKEQQAMEEEMTRRIVNQATKSTEEAEARILDMIKNANANGCNPTTNICVIWEHPESSILQSKGKGIAFRVLGTEDYAEVKTLGYSSNTTVTIIQNFEPATTILGDGSPGGNIVTIKQNPGVFKK